MGVYSWGKAVMITFGAILSKIKMWQCCLTQTLRNANKNTVCVGYYVLGDVFGHFSQSNQCKGHPKYFLKEMVILTYIFTLCMLKCLGLVTMTKIPF